jgi:hypothetical protein
MTTNEILYGVLVVPAVIGLVQVAKDVGMPARLAPALAVALGILAGLAEYSSSHYAWIQPTVIGIALGLSAVGLYSTSTSSLTAFINSLLGKDKKPAPPAPATTTEPGA